MYTAKKILKAEFLAARAFVASLSDDEVIDIDSCDDFYRLGVFSRRILRRRANRLYDALPEPDYSEDDAGEPTLDLESILMEALAE